MRARIRIGRSNATVRSTFAALSLCVLGTLSGSDADAQRGRRSLLVNTNPAGLYVYDGLHYQGGVWGGITGMLDDKFGDKLTQTPTLFDRGALMGYDALWVDQRWHHTPSADEVDNIMAFARTGRRVVIVGENATWGPWNRAFLAPLGGTDGEFSYSGAPGCAHGLTAAALDHALTEGVAAVNMACGGYAIGGTALFDYNVATLWGRRQNVLTVLDGNLFDDRFLAWDGGRQFEQNVVDWLGASPRASVAPEPATVALVGVGLVAVAAAVRRRR